MSLVRVMTTVALLIGISVSDTFHPDVREPRLPVVPIPVSANQDAITSFTKLPITFVPNAGQTDPRVRFVAQTASGNFYFNPTEAVFVLARKKKGVVLRLGFVGANPNPEVTGADPSAAKINYLRGKDPTRWRTGLTTYGLIVYHDLWPGIDLVFHGDKDDLKYEFHIAPGADPSKILLAYRGAERLSIDRDGGLSIQTALGGLKENAPVTFQVIDGVRVAVSSHYRSHKNEYGFTVGSYDVRRPLIIDPLVAFSTYLGGAGNDQGFGIAVDASSNMYVTGLTNALNFPTTTGAFDSTFNGHTFSCGGCGDAFITKMNATGLVYSTYIGGTADDQGNGIGVDSTGNAYITGWTTSTDFPTTPGAFDVTLNSATDAFVTKLSADGAALLYSTFLGGSLIGVSGALPNDEGRQIAVDAFGSAYVVGTTFCRDFPTTPGAFDTTYTNGAGGHAFVTKMNVNGSALVYSTYLGGAAGDEGNAIAIDNAGCAYVTGVAGSTNFPTTPGAFDTTGTGHDAYATKLNASGSALVYSTFINGSSVDEGTGIAVDTNGNAFVSGWTSSSVFPTTAGAFDSSLDGGQDAFVVKLNNSGSALIYGTYLGGIQDEFCFAVAVDLAGNASVTGYTISNNFPTTPAAFDSTFNGGLDVFLSKLNSNGSGLLYSTYFGAGGNEVGRALATDNFGSIYVLGTTTSNLFPVSAGAFDTTFNGGVDAFLIKLTNQPPDALSDEATTDEDNIVVINVLGNDVDPDGDPLSVSTVSQGANGSVTINPDNTLTYSPSANFNGTDAFTYTVADAFGNTDTANVAVTINPVNDPPVATAGSADANEDSSVQITLVATDLDSSDLTFSVVSGPTNGTLGAVSGSTVVYTPNSNFNGSDNFTFKANDGNLDSNIATISISVAAINDPPDAIDDVATTAEDNIVNINLILNDTDVEFDALTVTSVSEAQHGSVVILSDGTGVGYTPTADFFGADSFTYTVSDGQGGTDTATVNVTVTAVNDPPVASDVSAATNEDVPVQINFSASDVDSPDLTFSIVSTPSNGTLTPVSGSSVTYTPNPNFNGTDSFTFKANDGAAESNIATVSLSIAAVNDAPDAVDDSASTPEDTRVTINASSNDIDVDGDAINISAVSQPQHGSVAITDGGTTISYMPTANFFGTDSFSYNISDGHGGTDTATVNIVVNSVNDAPVASGDSYSTSANTALVVNPPGVLVNDSDIDGDALSAALVINVTNGTLALASNGSFTYTPNATFSGTDSFTYRASDGFANSSSVMIQIMVTPPPPVPCQQEGQCFVFQYLGYITASNGQTTIAFKVTNKCKNVVRMVAIGTDSFTRIAPADGSIYSGSLGTYDVGWTRASGNPGFVGIKFEPTGKNFKNGAADTFSIVVTNFNPNTTIQVKGTGPSQETFSFLLSQPNCSSAAVYGKSEFLQMLARWDNQAHSEFGTLSIKAYKYTSRGNWAN